MFFSLVLCKVKRPCDDHTKMSGISNLTDLPPVLTSSGQEWQLADLLLDLLADLSPSTGQEWKFHIATVTAYLGRSTDRSTPSPINWAQMPWAPLHQTWQIYPHQLSIDALSTITPTLADLLADLPPINQAQMPWVPLHQPWQIYWQIYPLSIEHRCLEYCYTNLGRSTGRPSPPSEHRCLQYCYTKCGRSTPRQVSIDALSTITPNMVDLPLPLSIKHRCLEYHHTTHGRSTPWQSSTDALKTITPNLADLPPHSSIDHWMSYCEIHNLISMGNMHIWSWGIQRLYHISLSLSLDVSLSILRSLSISLNLLTV